MTHSAGESMLAAMPEFEVFRTIVADNIGYVPQIKFDETSLAGHRVRIFRDPPGIDVLYSQRALARYIEVLDIMMAARQKDSADLLAAGLMILRGSDALRQNGGQGLALMASGFMNADMLWRGMGFRDILKGQITPENDPSLNQVYRLTNIFLPLAHEIGHVPEAQAISPEVLQGDLFLETYRINYRRVMPVTGAFDYAAAMNDPRSPLHLPTLREEVASDYFAVNTLCWLFARLYKQGEPYPLYEIATALFCFPFVMALRSVCLMGGRSQKEVQEIILAMHCRYSIVVDSVRSAWKGLFGERADRESVYRIIDDCIKETHEAFIPLYEMSWRAMGLFSQETERVTSLDQAQVIEHVQKIKSNVNRQVALANYLDVVAGDIEGYSVSGNNLNELHQYGMYLRTFDSILLGDDNSIRVIG